MNKKIRVLLICLTFLLIIPTSVQAEKLTQGQKDVKKVVTALMKNCKNYNAGKIRKYFVSPQKVRVFYKNWGVGKFIKKINKKNLKYQIGDIAVKGEKATAKVEIEYWNFTSLYNSVYEDIAWYALNHLNNSHDKYEKYIYKRLLHYYKRYNYYDHLCDSDQYYGEDEDVDGKETKTIRLDFVKKNGKWKAKKMPYGMRNAIHGSYALAYNSFDWDTALADLL